MELELADVSLRATLENGADDARRAGAARRGRARAAARAGGDRDQADERKIRQVVFNLLSNAVKLTPPGAASTFSRA